MPTQTHGRGQFVAQLRDAVRVMRGKAPRHTQHLHVLRADLPRPGIQSVADLAMGTLAPGELPLLQSLVERSRAFPGPIIEIGTLVGGTTTSIALAKDPAQKIITVDLYCWNPWQLEPEAHYQLAHKMLRYLIEKGDVQQVRMDKNEFFRTYRGPAPSLVFLDAIHDYPETKKDIEWAKAVGAKIIAGHDYCDAFPGTQQAVDEFGGPAELGGTVWCLAGNTPPAPAPAKLATATPATATPATATPATAIASAATVALHAAPANAVPAGAAPEQDQQGLVSIVVPAYNAADYFPEALADIDRQTYQRWELIVVEDGSTDDVEAIMRSFERAHPQHRVVYHRKPQNSGVSNTRNQALALCQGEYVAFLDGDDRWLPEHLERKIQVLNKHGADLAYSRVEMFDSDTQSPVGFWGPDADEIEAFPVSLFRRSYLQPSGVVMRRSATQAIGEFDESLHYAEDYDYWFRAVQAGQKFAFDRKVTSRYRQNHDNAATTGRKTLCNEFIAKVSSRYLDQLPGIPARCHRIVARHFRNAGLGHFAIRPSRRNRCQPELAPGLLWQAWQLQKHRLDFLALAALTRLAVVSKTVSLFRPLFHRYAR